MVLNQIDVRKFDEAFRSHPRFNDVLRLMHSAPYLIELFHWFTGMIKVVDSEDGPYHDGYDIGLNQDQLDELTLNNSNSSDWNQVYRLVLMIAHELAHAVIPGCALIAPNVEGELVFWSDEDQMARAEGVALLAEYRVARELGIETHLSPGKVKLFSQMNQLVEKYGSITDEEFTTQAIEIGRRHAYGDATPQPLWQDSRFRLV